ncbi:MAG: hypothetical protein AMS16_07115, partial [Planctomycetes bacterium DG_58]
IRLGASPRGETRGVYRRIHDEIVKASWLNPMDHPVTALHGVSQWRLMWHFERYTATAGCAKLAIALRLQAMKHGRYPEALAQLVPEFLDKLPSDPFSGKGFIYRKEGQGFIVYSVGVNGADDGGVEDPDNREAGDIVWKCPR